MATVAMVWSGGKLYYVTVVGLALDCVVLVSRDLYFTWLVTDDLALLQC